MRAGRRWTGGAAAIVSLLAFAAAGGPVADAAEPRRYLDPVFERVEVDKNIAYGSAVNNRGVRAPLELDLYQPAGDELAERAAAIVLYGGGFKGGNKSQEGIVWMASELARRGYVAAAVNYRTRPPGTPGSMSSAEMLESWLTEGEPEPIADARHDVQAAIRWLHANSEARRIDPDAIIALGSSAGAVAVLGAALRFDDPGRSGNPGHSSRLDAAMPSSGAWNPADARADAPPVLMINGDRDRTVPYGFAVQTCDAISAAGARCELLTREGIGHNSWDHRDHWLAESTRFACLRVPALRGCRAAEPDPEPVPTCAGLPATIVATGASEVLGTRGRDVIVGSPGAETIRGRGGRDVICSRGGPDQLFGNRGRDRLVAGRGADLLRGGRSRDRLRGGPGRDRLRGGRGHDACRGGPGRDRRRSC